VIGYRKADLKQVSQWDTPNFGPEGSSGIWQSGRGLVASDDGYIYLMTGNDKNFTTLEDHTKDTKPYHDPWKSRLANSFLKLEPSPSSCSDVNRDRYNDYDCGLVLVDSFTPKNSSQLSAGDTDLGSSGPLLLPGNRLIGGGKEGRVYVLDTSTMQLSQDNPADDGREGFQPFVNNWHNNGQGQSPVSCTAPYGDGGDAKKYCSDLHKENLVFKCQWSEPPFCFIRQECYQYCQGYGPKYSRRICLSANQLHRRELVRDA